MLLGNYSILNNSPGLALGGSTVADTRANFGKAGQNRNRHLGGFEQDAATPNGYLPPNCWVMPKIGGGMSMRAIADGDLSATLIPSYPMTIDLTGSGSMSATAGLVVSMLAAFTGSGTLAAAITGRLNATIDLTGSGDLSADMSGLANAVIDLTGSGDLDATISAFGDMTIDIVVTGTGLSTANVGQAVWAAIAASNNDPGTMGEKLNDAGSASNPWTEVIESGYTAAEILRIIAASTAGKTTGAGTSNMVFTGLDGTTNRIDGTLDASGNRTAVTLDGA